jgi:hypothetical protein
MEGYSMAKMTAMQAAVSVLESEGVRVAFGVPGAAILPFYEALKESDIRHVLVRHEEGGTHAAEGYTRARAGNIGVCVFRLNFSHGRQSDHHERHEIIRRIERDTGRPISIMADLQGPKLFAAKLSATDILFSAEILGLRSGEQRESSLFFRRSSLFVTREAMRKPGPRETARRSFNYT